MIRQATATVAEWPWHLLDRRNREVERKLRSWRTGSLSTGQSYRQQRFACQRIPRLVRQMTLGSFHAHDASCDLLIATTPC